jgi:hypothetical protein
VIAADFLVVPIATCRELFVLAFLSMKRRRVVHVAVTDHPPQRERLNGCAKRSLGPSASIPARVGSANSEDLRPRPHEHWVVDYFESISDASGYQTLPQAGRWH